MNTRRGVPGPLKATLRQQVNRKIKELKDEGKIADDSAENENGFQSWVELMTVIDDESPDPVRLDALKAMFFAVNKVNESDAERILAYQLFQIAKKLTSGQLFYLNLCYRMYKARDLKTVTGQRDVERKEDVSKLAHAILAQLHRNNPALVDLGLFATRLLPEPFDQDEGDDRSRCQVLRGDSEVPSRSAGRTGSHASLLADFLPRDVAPKESVIVGDASTVNATAIVGKRIIQLTHRPWF